VRELVFGEADWIDQMNHQNEGLMCKMVLFL